jgi:tetratricopeptide (TPR) repeat protein
MDHPSWPAQERGRKTLGAGDWKATVIEYRRATTLEPTDVQAWSGLGSAYQAGHDYRSAAEAFSEAVRIAPDLADAWYNLGGAYYSCGEYEKAVDAFRAAIRLRPQDSGAWYYLGATYVAKGDRKNTLAVSQQLRRLDLGRAQQFQDRYKGFLETGEQP